MAVAILSQDPSKTKLAVIQMKQTLVGTLGVASTCLMHSTQGLSFIVVIASMLVYSRYRCKVIALNSALKRTQQARAVAISLPDSYVVINDLDTTVHEKRIKIDTLVIGPNGLFIIKSKNLSGQVPGEDTRVHKHARHTEYDPIKHVGTQVYRLKTFLRENNINAWIQGIVCFSRQDAKFVFRNADGRTPVFNTDDSDDVRNMRSYIVDYDQKVDKVVQKQVKEMILSHFQS